MYKGHKYLQALGMILLVSSSCTAVAQPTEKLSSTSHQAKDFPGFINVADQKRAFRLGSNFATEIHVDMVMSTPESRECSDVLARAQWRQDILLATVAKAHYDNCQFDEATSYLQEQLNIAYSAGEKNDRIAALEALGRALHGIQDFYSHSNYVERAVNRYADETTIPVLPVWTTVGKAELQRQVANGLISGYVWWESGNICPMPVVTHGQLSKDEPGTDSGKVIVTKWGKSQHQVARNLARQATLEFLRDVFSKPQLTEVATQCKNQIGVLLLIDNRTSK